MMSINENVPNAPAGRRAVNKGRSGLHPLHEAALRLAEIGLQRPKAKSPKTLLLCHGARAWRYSQPEAHIHLHITSPDGNSPVVLRLR
jgi:hypothetical protein